MNDAGLSDLLIGSYRTTTRQCVRTTVHYAVELIYEITVFTHPLVTNGTQLSRGWREAQPNRFWYFFKGRENR